MTDKKFTLKRREKQVEVEDEQGGTLHLTIREISGADRDSYMSLLASKVRLGPDGKTQSIKDTTGIHTGLLALCIYDDGKLIPKKTIEGWPSSTVEGLFELAADLSGLTNRSAEDLGNG
jgi:hypothetical protein